MVVVDKIVVIQILVMVLASYCFIKIRKHNVCLFGWCGKITTNAGVTGNTISENETFNFFGASFGGGYDIDGHMMMPLSILDKGIK